MAADPATDVLLTSVALGRGLDLDAVSGRLAWPQARPRPYARAFELPGGQTLYLFRLGAIVVAGPGEADEGLLLALERALDQDLLRATRDTLRVRVDPAAGGEPRMAWDGLTVGALPPDLLAAVALLLAQSTALERYEDQADALLEEAAGLADVLARTGRPPHRRRAMIRRLGRLTAGRLELARWFYLVDRPEETWESAEVAGVYDALFRNLELAERHAAMLHKLEAAQDGIEVAVDLWSARSGYWLEVLIVLLIAVEIVLALAGLP